MKRDPRLRPLSRDHHHALALARRAALAAAEDDPRARRETWDDVVRKFGEELVPHFEVEERFLLPAMEAAGEQALVQRVLGDHRAIRDLVRTGTAELGARLADFGARLADHVRFEERVLFPAAETSLADDVLQAVENATTGGPGR